MTWKNMKTAAFALAAVAALSGPALAQGEAMSLRENSVMIVMPDGRMAMRAVTNQAMLDEMVQKGRQLSAGQLVVMRGGKLYLVEDYKMPTGRMMSEHMSMGVN